MTTLFYPSHMKKFRPTYIDPLYARQRLQIASQNAFATRSPS